MKLSALTLGAYRLIIVISFWCTSPFISIECPSLSHLIKCRFEVYLVRDKYCYSCLFLLTIGSVNLLPGFHFQPVLISVDEVGLL
jgi:hypothetical protein